MTEILVPYFQLGSVLQFISSFINLNSISTLGDDQTAALEIRLKEHGIFIKSIQGKPCFFRRLFTGLSPPLPGFINREFHVGFLVD
jgi:hypothetical protein